MKKFLFLTMAVAAMASCSENEIVTEAPAPQAGTGLISFASQFGNTVATRADTSRLDSTISLGVFAYNGTNPAKIYDGIEDMRLRYVKAKDGWFLNPADHYYPANDSPVSFWAYGPKGNMHLDSIACDTVTGPKFILKLDSTDIGPTAVDLFATQEVRKGQLSTAGTPVTFTLKRLLSQVKFKAKTQAVKDSANYDIKIYDIAISCASRAKYANKAWSNAGDTVVWKPVDEDDTQPALGYNSVRTVGELVSLIPGQPTTMIVNARVYKKKQGIMLVEQTDTLRLDGTSGKEFLEAGKCYTYVISVGPKVGKIEFGAPQIVDWVSPVDTIKIPKP